MAKDNTGNMAIIFGFIVLIIIAFYLLFPTTSTPTPAPISNQSNKPQNVAGVGINNTISTLPPQSLSNNVILDMTIKPFISPINRGSSNQYNTSLLNKDKDLIIYYDFTINKDNINNKIINNNAPNSISYNGQLMNTITTTFTSTFTN